MRHRGRLGIALLLFAVSPACRGCMPDELTYEATGGGPTTSGASTSVTSSTAASTGDASSSGSATTEASSSSSAGGGGSSSGGGDGGGTSSGGGDGGGTSSGGGDGGGTSSGDGGGGGSASSSTGAGGTGGTSPCPASDDFEEGLSSCWTSYNDDLADTTVDGGVVSVVPDVDAEWDGADEAFFLFQEVEGDFSATLRVTTEPVKGGSYQLAGFFLRDPDAVLATWLQYATGTSFASDTSEYVALTRNGNTFEDFNLGDGARDGVLGLCRRGDVIFLARYLDDDGEWGVGGPYDPETYNRMPSFPDRIQVGFAVGNKGETLTATFDDFGLRLGGGNCNAALTELHP